MKQHILDLLQQSLIILQQQEKISSDLPSIQIERTRDAKHGDYASNVAMILSKLANMNPRALAELIIQHIPPSEHIAAVTIAGPGFINFTLVAQAKWAVIPTIFSQAEKFGCSDLGRGKKLHIEFVSANPTGPLHVGHGRGAAYGAALADLLAAVGYQVHREYYVNDAGRQMNILAASVWLRYLSLFNEKFVFPSNAYRGDYVVNIAEDLKKQHGRDFYHSADIVFANLPADEPQGGDKEKYIDAVIDRAKELLNEGFDQVHAFGLNAVLDDIKQDLAEFGVHYQAWFSEKSLMDNSAVQHAVDTLQEKNHLYKEEGAIWFKSSAFGDEKDHVLVRENGQTTYFASDIAYHLNKLERGFERVIDVLGADHHGYVPRVRAAMRALGADDSVLDVPLVQFAVLYRGAERVQMSTRSGSFVTLRELRDEVGKDAARFFYVMRKSEQHMDFDLDLAKSQSNDNPVYYIQYAHARVCSVFRQLEEKNKSYDQKKGLEHLDKLSSEYEIRLLDRLSVYPEIIAAAATHLEPHMIANYLRDLAQDFHTYYNAEKFILDDEVLSQARLCLINATRQVIKNGLILLGVSAPDKMPEKK